MRFELTTSTLARLGWVYPHYAKLDNSMIQLDFIRHEPTLVSSTTLYLCNPSVAQDMCDRREN